MTGKRRRRARALRGLKRAKCGKIGSPRGAALFLAASSFSYAFSK